MQIIRLGESVNAKMGIQFTSVLASNLQTRIPTMTSPACKILVAGTVTAVSGTGSFATPDTVNAPGVQTYLPSLADLVLGTSIFVFTSTLMEPREMPIQVVGVDPYRSGYYSSLTTGSTVTLINSALQAEATNDYWKDAVLRITSGVCAGQAKKITAYNGTTKVFTVQSAFSAAPGVGDTYELITA